MFRAVGSRGLVGSLIAVSVGLGVLALAPAADAFVYWANGKGDTIGRAAHDGTGVEPNFIPTGLQPCGVAVDQRYVYWANGGGSTIGRATLDGTNVDPNFITGASGPCGPSLNTATGTIFWANTSSGTIGKATLKGTQVNQSFIPASVANDPTWTYDFGNDVYWTSNGDEAIWRAFDVDGSGAEQFLPPHNTADPLGVLLIPDTGFFGPAAYWASNGAGEIGEGGLSNGTLTNPNPHFIQNLGPVGSACGLAADSLHLYWGSDSSVGRAFLDGTSVEEQFIPGTFGACGVAVDPDRADASLLPSNFNFGGVLASGPAATEDFTLSNSADTTVDLLPDPAGLTGPNADQYSITGGTCTLGITLSPGDSCTITVSFDPSSIGGKAAKLVVDSNDPSGPARVALFGTGTAVDQTVTPPSIDFGGRLEDTISSQQTVTLTNGPGASSSDVVDQVTLGGPNANQFLMLSDGCSGTTLTIGGSCQVSVAFAPTNTGEAAASLSIPSSDPTSPATVALFGTGTSPDEDVSPGSLAFGGQPSGTESATQSIAVANSVDGTGPLGIDSVSLAGSNAGSFKLVFDGCSGRSVSPGDQCDIGVRFAPSAQGPQSGSVLIPSNGATPVASVALSGTGGPLATIPPNAQNPRCESLRHKLKKAHGKSKRRALRKKLHRRGCR